MKSTFNSFSLILFSAKLNRVVKKKKHLLARFDDFENCSSVDVDMI